MAKRHAPLHIFRAGRDAGAHPGHFSAYPLRYGLRLGLVGIIMWEMLFTEWRSSHATAFQRHPASGLGPAGPLRHRHSGRVRTAPDRFSCPGRPALLADPSPGAPRGRGFPLYVSLFLRGAIPCFWTWRRWRRRACSPRGIGVRRYPGSPDRADYAWLHDSRPPLLRKAWDRARTRYAAPLQDFLTQEWRLAA